MSVTGDGPAAIFENGVRWFAAVSRSARSASLAVMFTRQRIRRSAGLKLSAWAARVTLAESSSPRSLS